MKIRTASVQDAKGLAQVVGEFGYPATPEKMKKRLEKINSNSAYLTLLAERDGMIIGMLGMHVEYSFVTDDNIGRILAMVVHANDRNQGIGRKLLEEAESWALEKEVSTIVLNSGNREERRAAHAFYERSGYRAKSTGFYKKLLDE